MLNLVPLKNRIIFFENIKK